MFYFLCTCPTGCSKSMCTHKFRSQIPHTWNCCVPEVTLESQQPQNSAHACLCFTKHLPPFLETTKNGIHSWWKHTLWVCRACLSKAGAPLQALPTTPATPISPNTSKIPHTSNFSHAPGDLVTSLGAGVLSTLRPGSARSWGFGAPGTGGPFTNHIFRHKRPTRLNIHVHVVPRAMGFFWI